MSPPPGDDRVELRSPPNLIGYQFGQQWSVATPFVFRYEDKRWIEAFFETGALRLSTFSRFATYPDEMRGDTHEGRGFGYGENTNKNSIVTFQAQGANAAVLCCSHRLDHKLRKGFGRDSAFEITNTTLFAFEVSRQLPGFQAGLEGACIYRANASIQRAVDLNLEQYRLPDGGVDMQMLVDAGMALGGAELLLMKRKTYESQQEYRILWELDALEGEYIDVLAPKARQFCRRIKDNEWD
jgi:hypothetical protein